MTESELLLWRLLFSFALLLMVVIVSKLPMTCTNPLVTSRWYKSFLTRVRCTVVLWKWCEESWKPFLSLSADTGCVMLVQRQRNRWSWAYLLAKHDMSRHALRHRRLVDSFTRRKIWSEITLEVNGENSHQTWFCGQSTTSQINKTNWLQDENTDPSVHQLCKILR